MALSLDQRPGKIVAARRCNDNAVVYLAPGGSWEENPAFARIVTKPADQQRLLRIAHADAENRLVFHPHLADEAKTDEAKTNAAKQA
ncbi:MAG: DUF2849 domain-containing protein [Proteobacteria bacterium]|nr:DUF2849 domain-containing protein [Pseudomonadota bacterium]MDA1324914.1 DUF2849 domain-containing protein [Pseudomonadota bacterium]